MEGPFDVGERGWFPELSSEERNAEERPPRVLKKRGKMRLNDEIHRN